MSWNAYVDNLIVQSRDPSGVAHVDRAAIVGMDGSVWTSTGADAPPNLLQLSAAEAGAIVGAFSACDFEPMRANGVHVAGVVYAFDHAAGCDSVRAHAAGLGEVSLASSKRAVVVAHAPEGAVLLNVEKGVTAISEDLESMGI